MVTLKWAYAAIEKLCTKLQRKDKEKQADMQKRERERD